MPHQKDSYSPYQIQEITRYKAHLEAHRVVLREKFKKIIERYHFDNLKNLPEEERAIQQIEIFHGSGSLDFRFYLIIEDDESDPLFDGASLFPAFDYHTPQSNFKYPSDLDVYLEEYREEKLQNEKWVLTFQFLVEEWQRCGGHRCGTFSATFQNNAASIFDLIRFGWDGQVAYLEPEVGAKMTYPFPRDLTSKEIENRLGFKNSTYFKTKWRYFEKDNEFKEYGTFGKIIGYRSGKVNDFNALSFSFFDRKNTSTFEFRKQLQNEYNELIIKGYYEKERPNRYPLLVENLIEWDVYPRFGKISLPDKLSFSVFEEQMQIKLPSDYQFFLTHANGCNFYKLHFAISKENWREIKSLYSLEELPNYRSEQKKIPLISLDYLPIGEDVDENLMLLKLDGKGVFLYSLTNKSNIKLEDSFEDFIYGCTPISEYFQPKYYHLEKKNIGMLRKWLSEGWDVNEKIWSGKWTAIRISNDVEITELLLQHGADVNEAQLNSDMTPEYLQLMVNYGMDIKERLDQMEWLKKRVLEDSAFEKFHTLLE